ncbi:MAG: MarR family winged helix-turn-helix transcriptional regulator [Solirubrobacteraceae bacterium]
MQTTPVPDLAGRLRLVIARTARRLRQEAGGELSPSLTAALATLERHAPLTPSELAARERIQRPTATRLIARLEDSGLLARTPDPTDGRSSLVSPTPAARELMDELRTRKTAYLARRLEALEPEERAVLERAAGILEKVLEA